MKRMLTGLAVAASSLLPLTPTIRADDISQFRVQPVGVIAPWRGWGVARPYGAPLGYNNGRYGVRGYRGGPYYGYGYRPYGYSWY
ncbi:MAG TPA: hypothetical protein VHZ24_01475 [Pirellulales bacterium]|jgi:hypothetical protein|nr:hypothetical protein [Pirellulales bacterium]